jgi:hypothetical protein
MIQAVSSEGVFLIFKKSGLWLDVLRREDHLPFQEMLVKDLSNDIPIVNKNPKKPGSCKKSTILGTVWHR